MDKPADPGKGQVMVLPKVGGFTTYVVVKVGVKVPPGGRVAVRVGLEVGVEVFQMPVGVGVGEKVAVIVKVCVKVNVGVFVGPLGVGENEKVAVTAGPGMEGIEYFVEQAKVRRLAKRKTTAKSQTFIVPPKR
jgi:hypothetical protein